MAANAIPGAIDTTVQPPLRVPLWHFLVGLSFLLVGGVLFVADLLGLFSEVASLGSIAVAHVLLVGWVGVTILGAMTQFVPVWSGVRLHSERLALAQLVCVSLGLTGLAIALVFRPAVSPLFASVMVLGFVLFVYNLGRTLSRARPWDVTEGHFALALGFFGLAVLLGMTLALGFSTRFRVYPVGPVTRTGAANAHVTLAVFGGVFTTIAGALYQLGPMFTQSDPTPLDDRLRQVETVALPVGVTLLAGGRLLGHTLVATVGGLLVCLGLSIVGVVLCRRLADATVDYSPMLPRYAIGGLALVAWSVTAAAAWVADPLSTSVRFGLGGIGPVLLFAAVATIVVGTLYHVVPFLVWVHEYSDRLGFEPVPTIDDLYDARLARVDLLATVGAVFALLLAVGLQSIAAGATPASALTAIEGGGGLTMVGGSLTAIGGGLTVIGGGLGVIAATLVAGNLFRTVRVHAPSAAGGRFLRPLYRGRS